MAGQSGPQAGQHLFTPVAHPELRQLGQKNIHVFLKDRERYLLRLQDANAASNAQISAITLKASVDPDPLQSLIDFEEFGDAVTSVDTLTDDILNTWLEEKVEKSLDTLTLSDLEAAVKSNVRINVNEPNAEIRIMRLFTDYRTLLRVKKWESLVDENTKVAVQHIVELLKPLALKTRVENDLDLGRRDLRKDWKNFYKYVRAEAVHCEKYVPIKAVSMKNEAEKPTVPKDSSRKASSVAPHSVPTRSIAPKQATIPTSAPTRVNGSASTASSVPAREEPDCLNKKCKGKHRIQNCPITPKEEQDRLLKEIRMSKNRIAALLMEPAEIPEQGSGRYSGTLADKVSVTVNGDYGADHSALSAEHLKQCADSGIFIPILPLSSPVEVELALGGKDDEPKKVFSASRKARISTTLDTSKGPMRLRNVEYLVFDESMPEVLLSRPLLQSMGFNLDEHFASVRDTFHDTDFSHVGFSANPSLGESISVPKVPGRLASLLLSRTPQENDVVPIDEAYDSDAPSGGEESMPELETTPEHSTADLDVPSPLFYGDVAHYDPIPSDDECQPGENNPEATLKEIESMVSDARENGLSESCLAELESMTTEYRDVFRTRLGDDPPLSVPTMKIDLVENHKPIRVKVRRYSPPQAAFLRSKVDELRRLRLVCPNNSSRWACAPLVVPKPGPEKFRFTVDLRPVNSQTVPHSWPMPNMELASSQLAGSTCYAIIDLCHGYWQLAFDENSQECQSFVTPDGVFTPTRVMQGQTNAVSFFQSTIQELCLPIRENSIQWLDNILIHAKTAPELLGILRKLFHMCTEKGLKLHARKCKLFLLSVKWCGMIISKDGIRMDPSRNACTQHRL